jgi:uncharacterized alkaline shock family protein YloU
MTNATKYHLPAGRIEVLPRAIARIAAHAALAGDGVVGLTQATAAPEGPLLAPPRAHQGVDVRLQPEPLAVELYVVLRYGAPIASVAEALAERVRTALAHALGGIPIAVHVRVQGLRAE